MNTLESRYNGFKRVIIDCKNQIREYEKNLKKERKKILDLTDLYFELRKHTSSVRLHEKCSVSNKIMLVIGPDCVSNSSGRFIIDYYPNSEDENHMYKMTIDGKYLPISHYHSSLKSAIESICLLYESKEESLGISFISTKDYCNLLNNLLSKF